MTNDEFRKLALEIPKAIERSHMNHPDFRVAGKIFASLGVPDQSWGMVKLTPEQQHAFIKKAPAVFKPCSGAWGRQGYTNLYLPSAKSSIVRAALDAAAKNVAGRRRKRPTLNTQLFGQRPLSGSHRQPLQGVLEKRAFESRLKWARIGFSDTKLRTDFELGSTMDFHVHPAALC